MLTHGRGPPNFVPEEVFDPARGVVSSDMRLAGVWPCYRGRMGIHATWKPSYPDPTEMDSEVVRLVDRAVG
ncbi:MAG TPA: hypothetical protein VFG78_05510 [Gemmatimonadota bacterium]|nr:hypothetical protein [Gemmatimonadota bacterium]